MKACKVTDPGKKVTDPVLLAELDRRGINSTYVEFTSDYGKRVKGKSSPHAKFYRDLRSDKRFAVISQLPMADTDGKLIEAAWAYNENQGAWYSGLNLFSANVKENLVTITCLSDRPDGRKEDDTLTFRPQVFLNGVELKPESIQPDRLETDPENENYHRNVLQWDYGICVRKLRIIEGGLLGSWVFREDPEGEVKIKYNQSGDFRLKLGSYAISDDEELVTKKQFENSVYPLTVSDSATFYSSSGDGGIRNSGATYSTVQSASSGNEVSAQATTFYTQNALSGGFYYVSRIFLPFDTSALPDGAIITEATLAIYGAGSNTEYDAGYTDLKLYEGTQAEPITMANFDSFNSTLLTDDASPWEYPLSGSGYSTISLNAAGIALINKTGITKYCIRQHGDVNALQPTSQNYAVINLSEKGSGYKPKLVVTYIEGETKTSSDNGGGVESIALRELGIAESGNGFEQSQTTAFMFSGDAGSGLEIGGLLKSLYGQDEGSGLDSIRILTNKTGYDMKLHSHQGQVGMPHKEVKL
jgi:hypothetical protein